MWSWEACSESDLIQELKNILGTVPPRGAGRTKEHTERWILRHLLATLAQSPLLAYPVAPEKGERPDLVLQTGAGSIGIEVTEAVPEVYAQVVAIRNREFPGAIVDGSLFNWGSPPRAAAEIRDILRNCGHRLSGLGWAGDAVEEEWASAISAAVEVKTAKLNEPTFRRQGSNWLAIYDNVPGAALDLEVAVQKLSPLLASLPKLAVHFDVVTVESSDHIVLVRATGTDILPLVRP